MKNITLAGRLTKDAEIKTTNSGDKVTSFAIAVDDRSGKDKPALFFDADFYGTRGEKVAPYLLKGTSVTVTGDLTRREYDGKTYLGVRVDNLTLQGGGKRDDGPKREGQTATRTAAYDMDGDEF